MVLNTKRFEFDYRFGQDGLRKFLDDLNEFKLTHNVVKMFPKKYINEYGFYFYIIYEEKEG